MKNFLKELKEGHQADPTFIWLAVPTFILLVAIYVISINLTA